MCRNLLFLCTIFVGLTATTVAENPLRVYYEGGDTMEQITDHGVTLTVTLRDTGKENWVWVYVANHSHQPVNIIPANIQLHQNSPKDEDLRMKSERELEKAASHRVFWGQVLAQVGVATGLDTPDYEGEARWLSWADQLAQNEQDITNFNQHQWLRANTLFPGSEYAGRLIFVRDKPFGSGVARISIDAKTYEFPFPPPKLGPPPDSVVVLPGTGPVSASAASGGSAPAEPVVASAAETPGVLGVSGADWKEGSAKGFEILGIAPESAADLAGLHAGNVITDANGRRIRSTQDLVNFLAENGPGSKIRVGYMFKSIAMGWMPKETIVILTK